MVHGLEQIVFVVCWQERVSFIEHSQPCNDRQICGGVSCSLEGPNAILLDASVQQVGLTTCPSVAALEKSVSSSCPRLPEF